MIELNCPPTRECVSLKNHFKTALPFWELELNRLQNGTAVLKWKNKKWKLLFWGPFSPNSILEPHSRFRDNLALIRRNLSPKRDCGSKRVDFGILSVLSAEKWSHLRAKTNAHYGYCSRLRGTVYETILLLLYWRAPTTYCCTMLLLCYSNRAAAAEDALPVHVQQTTSISIVRVVCKILAVIRGSVLRILPVLPITVGTASARGYALLLILPVQYSQYLGLQ